MNAASSPTRPMMGATGIRARIVSIRLLLARVPLSAHRLLFRLAVAGVFFRAGPVPSRSTA